ncbi:fatty-acid-CoA ligase FadD9 [Mycolicibacterium canariasense]|uniref:Carboxylic acid reductase n=1 Tax=Mycolicibacterium canariasense TaxID=228230 RepID=A0A100WL29_MYCCR|nr:carboxylic acid reductase [Mycolicibacterium canariasense]MCV7207704.1 thioester reductase domain-containing protein [Mycolicibacterium canariasense]ORV08911.1 oxidoreductase [Mycolicibacterium canariasense]GAS99818.1 fatty-acid-CoA ligase FadD9 [Mycolicibacterium canariasense]
MTNDVSVERLQRRLNHLYDTDPQFAAAAPSDDVIAAVDQPGLRLPAVVKTVLQGYGDRPALGQRAVEFVTDPATGRTTTALLPRFETISHKQLWDRVQAIANAWHDHPVRIGDRVAILGFTSVDYTTVDTALTQLGAVSVPLQTSATVAALQPIVAETEPVLIATSIDYLDDAVALAESAQTAHLVVFDYHPEVDDQREAVAAAQARLGSGVSVEPLADVLERGAALPDIDGVVGPDDDPLALLIYTSGSTGAPKGAMYLESKVTNIWRPAANAHWDDSQGKVPSIVLSFMPMSHVMGRGILYGALASGGTVNFAARADLSTFLDDLALTRPTQLNFVPRIWDMLFQEFQSRTSHGADEDTVLADMRENLLGGRYVSALTGSAPISPELKAWVERLLEQHLLEGYGSTEAGSVFVDGRITRPPVLEYKLVDVPELGYRLTDVPHPRGELLVKSTQLFPGYYKRPEITAQMFDEDGFYRTGDIVAELGPDEVRYVDRRNNVLKLAQGEFVTVSKLEAAFTNSPLIRQIYIYGNSARPYLLAVVVPTDPTVSKADIAQSLKDTARAADLQSYEIPRDFLIETTPFTVENGLLTGIRKLAWPKLKERYGAELEGLYAELADGQANELQALRQHGADAPVLQTVSRATVALLGAASSDVAPDAHFTDLGGDSLSALTFGNLLQEIFGVEVPVSVIVSPTSDLATIAAHIETQRAGGDKRPTFSSVHGAGATEVHAADLTLDKFIDAATLAAAPALPGPDAEIRTVLLTGATGFLGRYLALEWLERMDLVDGKLICLVRARSNEEARARLDKTFDSGDPKLLAHYRELAADHLEVIAGDKGEADLGLDKATWQRLADTVDFIVDPAALVNHVLPYSELFGPNALGTAELIRIALTTKIKRFAYVSTIGVGWGIEPGKFVEDADIRTISATRVVDESYANGYGTSKWAGEVLLREAHDLAGLPVSVFRCDMILADTSYAGQLNLPDMFTRMMFSLVATGVAPKSFNQLDAQGNRQRAHYDGLPVEFIAEAIATLGAHVDDGFETYHVMNPYDDGIGMDTFVDWLVEAGYKIERVDDYAEWLDRFETTLRALPDKQRQASLLPLLHNYQQPGVPVNGAMAPTDVFRAAVQEAKIGPDKDIPHVGAPVIVKYITDLQLLGLL